MRCHSFHKKPHRISLSMAKIIFTVGLATLAFIAPAFADPVPPNRRIDWTYTGVPGGIPNRTTICAAFSPGATAAQINAVIQRCPANGVVFLNAGTYTAASLGGQINLYKSNVTLRGAGADQTNLKGHNIVHIGNGTKLSLNAAITGGASKGSQTFTVASTANLTVGTMIEIDRLNDSNFTFRPDRTDRAVTQVNMITAINGNTITVRNPLIYDFTAGSPRVKFFFEITRNSGIENLRLDHAGATTSSAYISLIQFCDSCWLKGVQSGNTHSNHFIIVGTLNFEVRDCYIHDSGAGPGNSGLNFYGSYQDGANSSAKIENNIFNKDFPAIIMNQSSSGFYIGYNYSYGTPSIGGTLNLVTWTFSDSHDPLSVMNLYEGNVGEMWGSDGYHGGGGAYGTALRNYFTGWNPNYNVSGNSVWLLRLAYYYNVVGNVLGSAQANPNAYTGCGGRAIYRLGYPDMGNCALSPHDKFTPPGGYPDPKVTATLLRWGNYDYFNKATRFVASEIPAGV